MQSISNAEIFKIVKVHLPKLLPVIIQIKKELDNN